MDDKQTGGRDLERQVRDLESQVETLKDALFQKDAELKGIYQSKTWKFGQLLGRFWGAGSSLWKRGWRRQLQRPGHRWRRDASYLQGKKAFDTVEAKDFHRETIVSFMEGANPEKGICLVITVPKMHEESILRADQWSHRAVRLSREFGRLGYRVIFVYALTRPLYELMKIDTINENLIQVSLALFSKLSSTVFGELGTVHSQKVLFLEAPYRYAVGLLRDARAHHWTIVYDILDNWEEFSKAGWASWYDGESEQIALGGADIRVTVSDFIREKFINTGDIHIVHNGYPADIREERTSTPLLRGRITAGYIGNMGIQRFDWDLLLSLSQGHDDWLFYLIGVPFPHSLRKCDNIIHLGQVRQHSLHSYAKNWDVGIVPFKKNNLTMSCDNLKIYEYLSFGLPVVARGVGEHFRSYPYVLIAEDEKEFEECIERAASLKVEERTIAGFLSTSDWMTRAKEMLSIVESHHSVKRAKIS
ncbi:MAG TPA: hypothetical protein VEI28_01720 [Thermodesulfovibrionales bacterium]|nr:hypothetical protein [Thermodesulfovibrionales bacterium]